MDLKASRFGVKFSVPGWREASERVNDLLCKQENSHKADRYPVSIIPAPPPQKGRLRQEDLQKLPGHHTWHCLKPGRREAQHSRLSYDHYNCQCIGICSNKRGNPTGEWLSSDTHELQSFHARKLFHRAGFHDDNYI